MRGRLPMLHVIASVMMAAAIGEESAVSSGIWPHAKEIIQAAAASYLAFFALGLLVLGILAARLFNLKDSNRVRLVVFLLIAFFIGSTPFILSLFSTSKSQPSSSTGPNAKAPTPAGASVPLSIEEALIQGVWGDETDDDFEKPCSDEYSKPERIKHFRGDLVTFDDGTQPQFNSDQWIKENSIGGIVLSDTMALVIRRPDPSDIKNNNEFFVVIRGPNFPRETIWVNSGGRSLSKRCS